MAMHFVEGNEAIARAAVMAGCRFFAGYPITPATTLYQHMLQQLPPQGGICLQGEDEIASIGFCLGASMAGMKTMTATSGPGISLMSEQLSFAVGSEIPIVVVDVQRLGPSTGSATKGSDGDIQFLRWGNSGGLPIIVLCPVDVSDCFMLTVQAFNLAERYRCPVFIAAGKELSMMRESVNAERLDLPPIVDRRQGRPHLPFQPFRVSAHRGVPDFLPMGGPSIVRQTSSTHGEDGYITLDETQIQANQDRLQAKLVGHVDDFSFHEADGTDRSRTLLVAYGVTARAAKVAARRLREKGHAVSLLILKTLWPVPEALIGRYLAGKRKVVVIEMNMGQYVREIERLAGRERVAFYGRMNGSLIAPEEIVEMVMS